MILRPLIAEEPQQESTPKPIWPVIEKTQLPRLSECWLIPQPAHAALSGEIAAQLQSEHYPGLNQEVIQAIALHDAGWGMPDAAAIQESRATSTSKNVPSPKSFIKFGPAEVVNIWTFSIDTAQKLSAVGGYIVSQHFARIGRVHAEQYDSRSQLSFARFEEQEGRRQERLLKKIGRSAAELEPLVIALQFCDLLSLYICCGVLEDVIFPQKIAGREVRLRRTGPGECTLDPFPMKEPTMLSVSGVRHPRATKPHANAQTFSLRITTKS